MRYTKLYFESFFLLKKKSLLYFQASFNKPECDIVERDKQLYLLDQLGQMGVRMLHRDLLPAVWLCCLLAVQVHSCPDACRKCLGPENDKCVECRAGWMLHYNICVGTVCQGLWKSWGMDGNRQTNY